MKAFCAATILFVLISGGAMAEIQKATFAGGCFWCMHGEFASIDGVSKVVSGYTGGHTKNPTYEQVSMGNTGHIEAIEVNYDPSKIAYEKLLDIFWQNVDPLDDEGQFCDKGSQYLAGIFVHSPAQKKAAETSREKLQQKFGQPIASFVRDASVFYAAEEYHQDYYIKNKTRYKMYRMGCGRDARLEKLWKNGNP